MRYVIFGLDGKLTTIGVFPSLKKAKEWARIREGKTYAVIGRVTNIRRFSTREKK